MNDSSGWGIQRSVTLLVVLTLHLILLAALVMMNRTRILMISADSPVELLYLPPVNLPKVRAEMNRPRRLSGDMAITIAPPALDSLLTSAPSASPSDSSGSGVDWAAEARRALQAFEIRNHQPPITKAISSKPVEDDWWPQLQHRAGDQYKTASGDWIVWINASCYQVASSAPSASGLVATPARAICRGPPGTAAK